MLKARKCKICGKEFIPTASRQVVCKEKHFRVCPVCGREFEISYRQWKDGKQCCSEECRKKKIKLTYENKPKEEREEKNNKIRQALLNKTDEEKEEIKAKRQEAYYNKSEKEREEIKEKYKKSCQEKWGVDNVFMADEIKDKSAKTLQERYGVDNISKTPEMRERLSKIYKSKTDEEKEEIKEKQCKTNMEHRGVPYSMQDAAVREKARETVKKRYGVEYTLQAEEIKKKSREECLRKYGTEYYSQSQDYRDKVQRAWENKTDDELGEIQKKREETNLERYGEIAFSKTEEGKKRFEETMQERYGVKNPAHIEGVQEQKKQTNLERYGVEYSGQAEVLRERQKQTWAEKTEEEMHSIQEKREKTNLERYNETNPCKTEAVKQKHIETSLKRYGTRYPNQSEPMKYKLRQTYFKKTPEERMAIIEKARKTSLERYGTESWQTANIKDKTKVKEFLKFKENPREYIENEFRERPTPTQLSKRIGAGITTVDKLANVYGIRDMIAYKQSNIEQEVKEFLLSLDGGMEIIEHDRKEIAPLELDFYLPEYRLAIECNPTYTHNSSVGGYKSTVKMPSYHKEKSLRCGDKGIFLFHIFGYEWENKQEIIKSMIKNLLHKTENRVYARECEVVEISQRECDEFLLENHRQGTTKAKYRIGLKIKTDKANTAANAETDTAGGVGELVAVMCFKRLRNTVVEAESLKDAKAGDEEDKENILELTRFCSLLNTTVVGGASKMFKYFTERYRDEFSEIVSYSDIAHTEGGVYKVLGFRAVKVVQPTYRWVNAQTEEVLNRERCRKERLPALFSDEDIDIENRTETEIMEEHGYVKVYDSGLIRWEYQPTYQY